MSAIDALLDNLQEKYKQQPDSRLLQETIHHLNQARDSLTSDNLHAFLEVLRSDLEKLEADGVWERTPEKEYLLQDLVYELAKIPPSQKSGRPRTPSGSTETSGSGDSPGPLNSKPIVAPPPSAPTFPDTAIYTTLLPAELVETLNQTWLLHQLATDPEAILPPGKSLLSVAIDPEAHASEDPTAALRSQVEDMVHKVFWDEALESLSNPAPAVEMPRLKKLYDDLHVAIADLLPPGHPVLITLSSPLSPTSAPLRSAIGHLRETLAALRERCAPSRDAVIDTLLARLNDPIPSNLPQLIVETVRDTLKFAEQMKKDLSQFVLGTMGEKQLHKWIVANTTVRERELIHSLWGEDKIRALWKEWMAKLNSSTITTSRTPSYHQKWRVRLMQALGTPVGVSCKLPTQTGEIQPSGEIRSVDDSSAPSQSAPPNSLPPPLFFVTPSLLMIQNYLQGLVIAASLRSLVRLPASTESTDPSSSFTRRVWILLKAEIENQPGTSDTKLIHLADEIVQARRSVGGTVEEEEEKRLRAAVDRTLRDSDPVFMLLTKRLVNAMAERLLEPPEPKVAPSAAGIHMQTGRGDAHRKNGTAGNMWLNPVQMGNGIHDAREKRVEKPLIVKGFEEAALVDGVTEVMGKLRVLVEWTDDVWGEVIKDEKEQ
ncbi:hypothetical protein QCA50_009648 [Cerrena zonata]|uniref:Uncharacterized protein n=1 Tax=Cerrena zonata TaxID=2478898 RepID=A0AAW0GDK2_9APHY